MTRKKRHFLPFRGLAHNMVVKTSRCEATNQGSNPGSHKTRLLTVCSPWSWRGR
uniref:Uncharacterized protein n=1 Tax=Arundo donax TaxID=35708 RepID=A0A0A9B0Q1_ARUDO